jgi:hypothetical protein
MSQPRNDAGKQDEFLSWERLSYLRAGPDPLLISQQRIGVSQQCIRACQLVLDAFYLWQEALALFTEVQWNGYMAAELSNEVPEEAYARHVLNDQSAQYLDEAQQLLCRAQQLEQEAAGLRVSLRQASC